MKQYLGIDTSNYTTSAALFCEDNYKTWQSKKLLPVSNGALGLKQSDAVFSHVKQLYCIIEQLIDSTPSGSITAVASSIRPRDREESYMPCFLVGTMAAQTAAKVLGVPYYEASHQTGHLLAALYGAQRLDLIRENFIAFHISGGTTECLKVYPDKDCLIGSEILFHTLDLNAGQAIDRVGGMLGLSFPSGTELEKLADESEKSYNPKVYFKDGCPSLSGLENQCRKMLQDGDRPCDIARYCLDYVGEAIMGMAQAAIKCCGELPMVFGGGVMSNSIIRQKLKESFNCSFTPIQYCSDNAVGIAVFAAIKDGVKL